MIVSALQGIGCFCEQRGEDDPSDARQGSQDRHVALLSALPLLGTLVASQFLGKRVELGVCPGDLSVDDIQARRNRLEMAVAALTVPRATGMATTRSFSKA